MASLELWWVRSLGSPQIVAVTTPITLHSKFWKIPAWVTFVHSSPLPRIVATVGEEDLGAMWLLGTVLGNDTPYDQALRSRICAGFSYESAVSCRGALWV